MVHVAYETLYFFQLGSPNIWWYLQLEGSDLEYFETQMDPRPKMGTPEETMGRALVRDVILHLEMHKLFGSTGWL